MENSSQIYFACCSQCGYQKVIRGEEELKKLPKTCKKCADECVLTHVPSLSVYKVIDRDGF